MSARKRKALINKLAAQGKPWVEIAGELRLSRQGLYQWIKNNNGTMWTKTTRGVNWNGGEENGI